MSKLNQRAFEHPKMLVEKRKVVLDQRDDWASTDLPRRTRTGSSKNMG
jgi:hypothetical protein